MKKIYSLAGGRYQIIKMETLRGFEYLTVVPDCRIEGTIWAYRVLGFRKDKKIANDSYIPFKSPYEA